jgi:hypothetical protein
VKLRERPYPILLQQLKLYFGPVTKRQSIEWRHYPSPWKENFKKSSSLSEVMITILWDCEGVMLVDAMERGKAVDSYMYIRMLTELRNLASA